MISIRCRFRVGLLSVFCQYVFGLVSAPDRNDNFGIFCTIFILVLISPSEYKSSVCVILSTEHFVTILLNLTLI